MDRSAGQALTPILLRLTEGRVGSTLVMQLVGTSSTVAFDRVYPFENRYLTYLVRLAGRIAQPFDADTWVMEDLLYDADDRVGPLPFTPQIIEAADLAERSLAGLWSAFSASIQARGRHPVGFYAEKYWGDLSSVIDAGLQPVVLDIVRDPRDVVASIRSFNKRRNMQGFGRHQAADDSDHLVRLTDGMAPRMAQLSKPMAVPRIVLRYEDLVSDLTGQSRRIENLLGIALDAEAVVAATATMREHITAGSVAASVGRWRQDLSAEDVRTIESKLGSLMVEQGYLLSGQ